MAIVLISDNCTFDKILDRLYLGDICAARSKEHMKNINIVVNASNTRYDQFEGIEYHHYDIEDNRGTDISVLFNDVNRIIDSGLEQDKNIFVHCSGGISRSVSLVLAYLVSKGYSLMNAIKHVKSCRTQQTRPNISFFRQLISYEREKLGTNSVSVSDYSIFN